MRRPYLLIWFAVAAFLLFFWIYFPKLSRYQELRTEEERIRRELADLDAKIKTLQEERNLLQNDAEYLERVIRQELGLVRPGEMVYKFVQEEEAPSPALPAEFPSPPQETR